MMAFGKGIGRFAARKSNPDSGGAIPSPPVEAPRPSTAASFASFDEPGSLLDNSLGFNAASNFDGGNFEDDFGGNFEGENFDDYHDGGNFDDEPQNGVLEEVAEGDTELMETSESLEDTAKEGATEEAPEESSNDTIPTSQTISDTYHRILPPLLVVPAQTAPTIVTNTTHSPRIVNVSSVAPSQGSASGIKMFGRPLVSDPSVVPPPHPAPDEARRAPQNGSIQAYRSNDSVVNPPDNRFGARMSQNEAKQFARIDPQTQHAPAGGSGEATNAAECGLPSTSTALQREPGLTKKNPELFHHRTTNQDLTSTPSPRQQTRHSSAEHPQRSFSRVTPDSASTTSGTVNSPDDLSRLSTNIESQSPMAKSKPEHELEDAIHDLTHLASSGEDFENLVSSFLADLQEAGDLWDRGDDEILALNVDMSETYATTLRVRGQLLDILDEIDQGLALQDEVMSELQEMLTDN
jgi:hypothetical protein